jgi:fibronectin type 3 domain-containing protein
MNKITWISIALICLTFIFLAAGYFNKKPDTGARLNPPTELMASLKNGRIVLTWKGTTSISESDYNIYQAIDEKGPFQKIGSTTQTSYEATGLVDGKTYYFQVTALLNNVAESVPAKTGAITFKK